METLILLVIVGGAVSVFAYRTIFTNPGNTP